MLLQSGLEPIRGGGTSTLFGIRCLPGKQATDWVGTYQRSDNTLPFVGRAPGSELFCYWLAELDDRTNQIIADQLDVQCRLPTFPSDCQSRTQCIL